MEKLYIRALSVVAITCISLLLASTASANKMSRVDLDELRNTADIVAVVTIERSLLTNKTQTQLHTTTPLFLIEHKARIVDLIKDSSQNKSIDFINTKGLIAGNRYIVFLRKEKDKHFHVMLNGYGAFRIANISMNQKVVAATRIPITYVKLPNTVKYESGMTTRDESAAYIWSELELLVNYLKEVSQ